MELIARNIEHFETAHSTTTKIYHSMLDWYFASDHKYLSELPVKDSLMK